MATLWVGCFGACKGAEFMGNKQKQFPLLVQIPTTILVLTDGVIYFQFQFPLACFYTMVEVK